MGGTTITNNKITPNKLLIFSTTTAGFVFGLIILYSISPDSKTSTTSSDGETIALAIFMFLLSALMATQFSSAYDITWDSKSIRGPESYLVLPFDPKITTIKFDEVDHWGVDWLRTFYVISKDGTKIRWYMTHRRYLDPIHILENARPDLFAEKND